MQVELPDIDANVAKAQVKLMHTIVDNLITKRKLIYLESEVSISKALETLIRNNIYSAPVKNKKTGFYIGFIDLIDIVTWVAKKFKETRILGDDFDLYNLDTKEKEIMQEHASAVVEIAKNNALYGVALKTPVLVPLKIYAATKVHRIFITKSLKDGKVEAILTQSCVIEFLSKKFKFTW